MFDTAPDLVHLAQIGLASIVLIMVVLAFMRKFSQYLALKVLTG
jgi:hypothetical protein